MENPLSRSPESLARRVRQHVGAREHDFFAVVTPGFEATCLAELNRLGIAGVRPAGRGGLAFRGRLESCWRLHIGSRTVSRVLMRLASFPVTRFDELRRRCAGLPWELHVPPGRPVSLRVSARKSRLIHSGRIEAEVGAAIRGRLAGFGQVPTPAATGAETQEVFVRLEEDRCLLSLDASGPLLCRRGTAGARGPAPLRATVAAAILETAGLDGYDSLLDPMAGSGIFSLEAGMMAGSILPGSLRRFVFQEWPAHRPPAYRHLLQLMAGQARPPALRHIWLQDVDERALALSRRNLAEAGLAERVEVQRRDFLGDPYSLPPGDRCLLVINPPFGGRLDPPGGKRRFFSRLGTVLRSGYARCGWAVIVPGLEMEKALAIPHDLKIPFFHGGIAVALLVRHAPRRG